MSMSRPMRRKIAFIGRRGSSDPAGRLWSKRRCACTGADELVLYDPDHERLGMMAELAIVAREGGALRVREAASLEDAVDGASFVMNSI